jgi:hypothetical protein
MPTGSFGFGLVTVFRSVQHPDQKAATARVHESPSLFRPLVTRETLISTGIRRPSIERNPGRTWARLTQSGAGTIAQLST